QSTLGPAVMVLPNGLRLIVQTETVSPTVRVVGSVRSNPALQEPHGKEGVAGVVDDLFGFGSTNLERLAFQTALDDIAATESGGSSFSLGVLAANFDRGVQLLADNELTPVFDPATSQTVLDKAASAP